MEPGGESTGTRHQESRRWRDAASPAALLALAGTWLVLLRDQPWIHTPAAVLCFYAALVAITRAWASGTRAGDGPLAGEAVPSYWRTSRWRWGLAVVIPAFLASLTWACYWEPLKLHFWGGYDDATAFRPAQLWDQRFDNLQNRPIAMALWWVAQRLTPDRVEGRLWVAAGLCFLNSALLYGIIRRTAPGCRAVAICAALLLLVSRADLARFYVMWATVPHWGPQCMLLLSVWLLLVSYERDSRGLLVAACYFVACGALTNEGILPLAFFAPGLLWLCRRSNGSFALWALTWLGTITVLAVRLVAFFLMRGASGYQMKQAAGTAHHPGLILENLWMHLRGTQAYFTGFSYVARFWPWAVATGVAAIALYALVHWATRSTPSRRVCLVGMTLGAAAMLLGMLPFLHIPGLFRTHLLAAPGEATLLAFALGMVGTFLPWRMRNWWLGICAGILVAVGTAALFRIQERNQALAQVFFEKTARVLRQVHELAPDFAPDTSIILVHDDGIFAPLGQNNHGRVLFRSVLGLPAYQANNSFEENDLRVAFTADGVRAWRSSIDAEFLDMRYSQLVCFRLSADGSLSFLRELPPKLVPAAAGAAEYSPLSLMKPGPVGDVPFLRTARWMRKIPDILDSSPSMMLGSGWSDRQAAGKKIFRTASSGAEIWINPLGEERRTIHLEVEPPSAEEAWVLQAVDASSLIAASAPLRGRAEVKLTVPVDRGQIQVFRLRLVPQKPGGPEGDGAREFRVFRPGKGSKAAELPTSLGRDVVGRGLRVGNNWHAAERIGNRVFRWVTNDAELLPGIFDESASRVLAISVAPGVSMGGQPCHLRVVDAHGAQLGEAVFAKAETIRIVLPRPLASDDVLRLHVDGGGGPAPGDSRILNFQVFSCELVD